ncbi:unnamed protein product [Trichobilharzia szidati]|nr:unnamed protein product [Trichobilharzia szidati]
MASIDKQYTLSMLPKCGCKGIRSCAVCEVNSSIPDSFGQQVSEFTFCSKCCIAEIEKSSLSGEAHTHENGFSFPGVEVIQDFVSESEEAMLISAIDEQPWFLSQSGRRKQDYGPKVNFKRQKVHVGEFRGLPAYSKFLITRYNNQLKEKIPPGQEFLPVELCNLEYRSDRGACIVPHFDDSWLWGERLVTLNLCGSTCLTFTLPSNDIIVNGINDEIQRIQSCLSREILTDNTICIRVRLDRRSLVVVSGPARYLWQHEIRRSDIPTRRIAMTFRELSDIFTPRTHDNLTSEQTIGKELLQIASTYNGRICNKQSV